VKVLPPGDSSLTAMTVEVMENPLDVDAQEDLVNTPGGLVIFQMGGKQLEIEYIQEIEDGMIKNSLQLRYKSKTL